MSDFALFGNDLFGEPIKPTAAPLADRFTIPPFSVLDARQGNWQERKRAWLSLGIVGELGRENSMTYMRGNDAPSYYQKKMGVAFVEKDTGTSIFDPVLCELAYRWFCPEGGQIVDPFAGGSVRGVVSALLGRDYWGCDLRQEQIDANEDQATEICDEPCPIWHCGDATALLDSAPPCDLVFTCPPYGDLERYSDDPADLSTMEYYTFIAAYKRIILRCSQKINKGGLACFVVGDFRDKRTGNYRGFVADTINAFREVGFSLYNDAILVTAVGSLPIRVGKQFDAGRKLGKTHQNILVFRRDGEKTVLAAGR